MSARMMGPSVGSKRGLLTVAIAVLISSCGKGEDQTANTVNPATPASPAASTVAKPEQNAGASAPVAQPNPDADKNLSVGDLLKRAASALAESRLVAPADNNAARYYLLVLEKEPQNSAARDGLREMFPLATAVIEQHINAGQFDEGNREIELLSKADANNYTLKILRAKLDAKIKLADAEKAKHDLEKQREQERLTAVKTGPATNPAATTPDAAKPDTPPKTTPAAASASNASASPASGPAKTAPAPVSAPATAAPSEPAGGETRSAKLVNRVSPTYPPDALRNHQEGWVEVSFTVGSDGRVRDASVVNANPPRMFNSAALRAVENWTFQPRLENGKPAEQVVRNRIEFKL